MRKDYYRFCTAKQAVAAIALLLASAGMVQATPTTDTPSPETSAAAPQQTRKKVKGTVSDAFGPVVGAYVVEKGTDNGTITNNDGNFELEVTSKSVLHITFIGYEEQLITVGNQTQFNITLKEDAKALEEVVVVGYTTQKKTSLTGSVSTVKQEAIANRPVMNVGQALIGAAPGVRVTQGSGNPGSESMSIQVRGQGSFNSSSPLVLVDGVVADMAPLNSDDIESISILKDASSAAIYGSRAANGVILITTKKGKKNEKPRVTFNALFAQEKPVTDLKFTSSTADFMELHNIAKLNANPTANTPDYSWESIEEWRAADANPNGIYTNPTTGQQIPNWLAYPNTDWAQILFQPAFYQRYGVNVSGGSENSSYLLSLGYQDNPGTLENTGMQRFNIRANVETKIADLITFGTQTYATKEFKDPGDVSMTYLSQAWPGITPKYQFNDIAMFRLVVGEVGQQEEVAIAVCHLHLWSGIVIIVEIKIGQGKKLNVAFSFYDVAHRREASVTVGHILQGLAPVAIKGHHVEIVLKLKDIHEVSQLVIYLKDVIVVLLPDVIVGDAKNDSSRANWEKSPA